MPDRFLSGRLTVNGLPNVNDTFQVGLEGTPETYTFVQSQGSPATQNRIVIGDSPDAATLASRIANAINSTDSNCSADVDGNEVNLTPQAQQDTVIASSTASVGRAGIDPNPNGIIIEGP